MKRLSSLALACLLGVSSLPAVTYAQQGPDPVIFSQQELDQLLAPIALYPDPLLSQVLMAATYPLEAVQAARFVRQNPSLRGDALARAVEGQAWDPSVKALVQFPVILVMMDDQLAWTQKLGDAFLEQQDAVMDTVQALRARAQSAGTLRSNQQQRVVMQDGAIYIEPYAADVMYVPYYDPTVVYGGWWWPDHPPMIWVPPQTYWTPSYSNAFVGGIAFGVGIVIVHSIFNDARPDWHRHHFVVNNGPAGNRSRSAPVVWTHNPEHRRGVAYRDAATRNRMQPPSNSNVNRDASRGHVTSVPQAPQSVPATRVPRAGEQIRPGEVRLPPPVRQTPLERQQVPNSGNRPRVTVPQQQSETAVPPRQPPVIRQPSERVPPPGPATERGRSSRAGPGLNQAKPQADPQEHPDNKPAPPRDGRERQQQQN